MIHFRTPAPASARPCPATCCEVFAASAGAAAGFVRAHLHGPALWVQDWPSAREAGQPWFTGWPLPIWTMRLSHPRDVLIAAEEALACSALSAVVAEIHGNPPALSFTASRRLAIRAVTSGVRLWLIRHGTRPEASALRDRWRVGTMASAVHPDDPAAPGDPCWRVELFRSRDKRPGVWAVRRERGAGTDGAADHLGFTALVPDREVAAPDRPQRLHPPR